MVSVDQSLCSGCGICVDMAPEIFAWGSDGKAMVIKNIQGEQDLEEIADACPTEAIEA